MTIRGPYEYPKYYIGLSTDIKSNIKNVGVGASVNVENFPAVISGATVPVSGTVNVGLTSQYALKLMEDSVNPGTISYVGEAVAGASHLDPVWRIKMMDTMSGVVIT